MMQGILSGRSCALMIDNIDTDQICPARFLHTPRSQGYGPMAFYDVRATEGFAHLLASDCAQAGPEIVLAGPNFGCGSSREQAVWALHDLGVRAVFAPSFGDIFRNNCANNGILTGQIDLNILLELAAFVSSFPYGLTVHTKRCRIVLPNETVPFEVTALSKRRLLDGIDAFQETSFHADLIKQYRLGHAEAQPWLFLDSNIDRGIS